MLARSWLGGGGKAIQPEEAEHDAEQRVGAGGGAPVEGVFKFAAEASGIARLGQDGKDGMQAGAELAARGGAVELERDVGRSVGGVRGDTRAERRAPGCRPRTTGRR